MEIIRRETDYALRCLVRLAHLEGDGLVSVKTLSDSENLPYELLRKVFQRMTKAGLVESVRGKQGGFRLAAPVASISFRRILEAVQGPILVNKCQGDKPGCPNRQTCAFHRGICEMQVRINALLDGSTLQDYV